MINHYSLI